MTNDTEPNKVEASDYTDDELVEIKKDFFFGEMANTLVQDQGEACAKYIEKYHSDDRRLILICRVLRGLSVPKDDLPWSVLVLVIHYDWLRKNGSTSEDALSQTANDFSLHKRTVENAVRRVRTYYKMKKGDRFPFSQCIHFDDEL